MLRLLAPLILATAAFAQPSDNPTPKTFPPDATTLKKIQDKTAELKAVITDKTSPDVAVYLKAAEWIVRHGEWYTEKSGQQTLDVLDAGLKRAKDKEASWLKVRGKPIACGYKSSVDGSVQPYSIRYPDDYDAKKQYRLDLILHGRDATLTEVKFLHAKETAKPGKPLDHFEVEVYGRGNNAYRWAGETDVLDVHQLLFADTTGPASSFHRPPDRVGSIRASLDPTRVVLRGFSMGGAGAWHLGLHHPSMFAVIGPGAGFTTTRGYIGEKKFGPQPDYIEKCLHIYDAVDYAENVFNVPVVAYSGEKDKQKLAADLIEAKLKDFKEPHSFTHLVAPGLEHKQPPEWMAKLETEYRKYASESRKMPTRNRFVTYTAKYGWCGLVMICPEKHYEKAVVDVLWEETQIKISTTGVRTVVVKDIVNKPTNLTIDGQPIVFKEGQSRIFPVFENVKGKWVLRPHPIDEDVTRIEKASDIQGPIDDAFMSSFKVALPTGEAWHAPPGEFVSSRRSEFEHNWDKYFRGTLPATREFKEGEGHLVLFGDPQSNPVIAKVLPKLPITWTKDELVVNGVKYDPKTHVPVLIYPNPLNPQHYVVINSGHTFREADLKGTNALLYPRLGDWAVLKPKPTKDDPAGFEVVAAGLFDENWQFEKKK